MGRNKKQQDDYFPEKREIQDLHKTFSRNLNYLLQHGTFDMSEITNASNEKISDLSQRRLSQILGGSSATVNNWCNENKTALPNARQLLIIGKGFHVTTDFLVQDHQDSFELSTDYTYWSVFQIIRDLSHHVGLVVSTKDPFLNYLLSESRALDNLTSMSPENRGLWYSMIKHEFDRQIITDSEFSQMIFNAIEVDPFMPEFDKIKQKFKIMMDYWEERSSQYGFGDFFTWCREKDVKTTQDNNIEE